MKKIIFALLVVVSTAATFVSCTEEEIAPNTENGGAVFEEPVKR